MLNPENQGRLRSCRGTYLIAVCLLWIVSGMYAPAHGAASLNHGHSIAQTVWTEVTIADSWQASSHTDPIWLVRLEPSDAPLPALGLVWRRETSGWFTTWKLQLYSEIGLLSESNQNKSQVIDLLSTGPTRGRAYEAALSYDARSGAVSVWVYDVANARVLVAEGLTLHASDTPLQPVAINGRAYDTHVTQVADAYAPVGLQWGTVVNSAAGLVEKSLLDPNDPLGIRIESHRNLVPGEFRLFVATDEKRELVHTASNLDDESIVFLQPEALPVGDFGVIMEYVDSGQVLLSDRINVSRGEVALHLGDLVLDDATGVFQGHYDIRSNVDLPPAGLRIDATIAEAVWDPIQGQYIEILLSEDAILDTVVRLKQGSTKVEFSGQLPIEAERLWRLRFTPTFQYPIRTTISEEERFLSLGLTGCGLGVMSFNIRVPSADGVNTWPNREALAVQVILDHSPDVIGLQEPSADQLYSLDRLLTNYERISIKPDSRARVHNAIYFNPEQLERLIWGSFWLSDTPDYPQSITWGNNEARAVIWAKFRLRRTGHEFFVVNTHYHHQDPGEVIRTLSSQLIAERLPGIIGDLPVVLMGDFNTYPDTPAYALLAEGEGALFADAWRVTAHREGPEGTFHGFTGESGGRRIDWILVSPDIRVIEMEHVTTRRDALFPSDHYPVFASVCLPDDID